MAGSPWTDTENDLIVADYFAMLAKDLAGTPYSKAQHRKILLESLTDRTDGAVEFKHQNISAVLKALGETWIAGYKPAFNFQLSLVDAVARWMAQRPDWSSSSVHKSTSPELHDPAALWVGTPPTLSNQPPPQELEQTIMIGKKFDVAARDERNRVLGEAGERLVLQRERAALRASGHGDLAAKVRWVSKEDGDGAGYDIESFARDGRRRLIEVKTTNGWERTPFFITKNELAVSDEMRSEWCLFRLYEFSRAPKAFELYPPLSAHVSLVAQSFKASFL